MCRESTLTVGHLSVTLANWLARVKTPQWDEPLSSNGDGQARSADCAEHYECHHTAAIHEPHWTIHIPKAWVEAQRPAQLRVCALTPRAPRADHGNGRPLINPDGAALADRRAITRLSLPQFDDECSSGVPSQPRPAAAVSSRERLAVGRSRLARCTRYHLRPREGRCHKPCARDHQAGPTVTSPPDAW
jgi:hypothetical protein